MRFALRLARAGVAVAAGVAVLAGCSDSPPDDAQPQATANPGASATPTESEATDPTPTPSSSPEPTPTPTMPTVEPPDDSPMYADFTEEAAIEFVQYFWDTSVYLQATKDAGPWDAASGDECIYCADFKEAVMEIDGYLHGIDMNLTDPNVLTFEPEYGLATVEISLRESPALLFDARNQFVRETSGGLEVLTFVVYLHHTQGQWKALEAA